MSAVDRGVNFAELSNAPPTVGPSTGSVSHTERRFEEKMELLICSLLCFNACVISLKD